MLKREGIDLDVANQAASTPSQKAPAPEPAPGGSARQGQAQPRAGLAPLLEELPQNFRPGKRTALDAIDAAIAELAEEPLSRYGPEDLRMAQPVAAAITLASMETVARWIRSTRARHPGSERRAFRSSPLN